MNDKEKEEMLDTLVEMKLAFDKANTMRPEMAYFFDFETGDIKLIQKVKGCFKEGKWIPEHWIIEGEEEGD